MFRVPQDPEAPSFDDVFKVSFLRWLRSNASDRHEWMRRRDVAAKVARIERMATVERKRAKHRAAGRSELNRIRRVSLPTDRPSRIDATPHD